MKQLDEFKALLAEMDRKLGRVEALLQKLVDQQQEPGNSYTVTISEDQWREWTGQEGQE